MTHCPMTMEAKVTRVKRGSRKGEKSSPKCPNELVFPTIGKGNGKPVWLRHTPTSMFDVPNIALHIAEQFDSAVTRLSCLNCLN
jgi:hypothetical protein